MSEPGYSSIKTYYCSDLFSDCGNFILNVKLHYWLKKIGKDKWDTRANEITESEFTQETQSECAVESLTYWNLEYKIAKVTMCKT